ncbi:putative serine/threonine-protein kinase nek2 [Cucumis melo var. makuwa]|uniref:Serine/threonine-protein kinase nek2 n=1 Tax=Cucumis melo var. makuwa TaxID=1194695 RepID=A0A5A7TJL2_CUCMM|nr:putative serine/threonine-protein kinase nek2 [Cucumis melo var. makuwa]
MQQGARCATIRQVGRRYCDPVELGTHKSKDHLDTSNIGRPLSMGVHFKPEQELLRQAHRYVLENTIDVQPYMDGGVRIDELGYTLVDLNRVGHKSDSFILASQAKQVFYVEDPSDVRWSIVLTPPQRDFEDRYNDDELGDTILQCEGIPNDMPDVDLTMIWMTVSQPSHNIIWTILIKKLVWKVVTYNEDGAPIGENGAKLKSFIGSATHYHVPIIYTSWKSVPLELKDKIFTTVEFKNWLTTKYIMLHKDAPQLLQAPPEKYSFIEQNHWEEFVRSRLSETFQEKRQLQQDRRSKKKYNHRISRKGYANLKEEMKESSNEVYVDRAKMWKKARVNKQGQYDNDDIQQVVHKIDEISMNTDSSSVNRHCLNDVLTQALGTKEHNGRVRGVNEPELDVLKERDLMKMPTKKEVVCESTSTLPLALKLILRYVEKVMEKDSSITFSLPADLFGISQTSVLREDIIDLCNMNEVKMFTLVAYMIYFYSSVIGSKEDVQYVFIDPSLISSGNIQESRIRNLCSRLMVSKAHQVVLAPFNPGGHWALLALNAYEDTVFYLDSLRTTSKATTRYVTDTSTTCGYYVMKYMREIVNRGSIVISDSIDTRKSYSQAELDEVRVELVEFLGSYI